MLKELEIKESLKDVRDPELNIDIVTLGLVYKITLGEEISELKKYDFIEILMTLTSPFCPYAEELIQSVESKINSLNIGEAKVEITFEPEWQPSEELKMMLGL